MTVSHGAEDRILGGERRTDGLWVHRGKLNLGGPTTPDNGLSGDLRVNRSSGSTNSVGTGAIYFGKGDRYLYFDGTSFNLVGGPLNFTPAANSIPTSAIQAGAVQQLIGSYATPTTWSTTVTGAYAITPITASVTSSGGTLRIECVTSMSHSVKGGLWYTGLSIDSVVTYNLSLVHGPDANYLTQIAWVYYTTPAAGAHTYTVHAFNNTAGTLSINASMNSCLWVTEQKR